MSFLSALFGRSRRKPETIVDTASDGTVTTIKIAEDGSYTAHFEYRQSPAEVLQENERALNHLMHWCSQFYHNDEESNWRTLLENWLYVGWGVRDIAYDYDRMLWLAKAWYEHPSTVGGQPVRFIGREIQMVPRPAKLDFMLEPEEFAALAARFRVEDAQRAEERRNSGR